MFNTILKTRWHRVAALLVVGLAAVFTILAVSAMPAQAQADGLQYGIFSGTNSNGGATGGGGLPPVNGGTPGLSGFRCRGGTRS